MDNETRSLLIQKILTSLEAVLDCERGITVETEGKRFELRDELDRAIRLDYDTNTVGLVLFSIFMGIMATQEEKDSIMSAVEEYLKGE